MHSMTEYAFKILIEGKTFAKAASLTSAIALAIIVLMIGFESVIRLTNPVAIQFSAAIGVAVVGLIVNLVSAWLLHSDGHHHGDHDHRDHII